MPCFDAGRFLPEALDSILSQTYRELEIVALDDGSHDATLRTLERYAAQDTRIRVLANETNLGLIATLNRGVAESRGELIARMDQDDVAAPHRIERQVAVLAARPEIGIVGTGIELMDERGRPVRRQAPLRCREPAAARFLAIFATPLAHPTVLARASIMRAHLYGHSGESVNTEDYELFTRMLADGIAFLNLDEQLVRKRIHAGNMSARNEAEQVSNFLACARRHLERTLGFQAPPGVLKVLLNRIDATVTAHDLGQGLRLLDRVEAEFLRREPGSEGEIRGIADEQRLDILIQAGLKGRPSVRLAAFRLALRYPRWLGSPRSRRYLVSKLML